MITAFPLHPPHLASAEPRCPRQAGFTMVEILAVLVIISVLSGIVLAGAMTMQRSTKVVRTVTIIETLRQAIELTASERGSQIMPAEHPLAGSHGSDAVPRMIFQRSSAHGGTILDGSERTVDGIRGLNPDQVPAAYVDRLLLDDDYFADPAVPALYGLQRHRIGYLGANLQGVTRYHNLRPPPGGSAYSVEQMQLLLEGERHLVASQDGPSANEMLINHVLASTTAKTELSKLNSRSQLDEMDALYVGAGDGVLAVHGRVWSPAGMEATSKWLPGHVRDPEDGQWKRYRIRGLGIYDAWGTEILYSRSSRGVVRLMSAGPSGVFARVPSSNGVFNSAANAQPSGGDFDGWGDNIILVTDDD